MIGLRQLIPYLVQIGSPEFRRWMLDRIPIERFQRLKAAIDTFHERSTEILADNKAAVEKARQEGREDEETKNLIAVLCTYGCVVEHIVTLTDPLP